MHGIWSWATGLSVPWLTLAVAVLFVVRVLRWRERPAFVLYLALYVCNCTTYDYSNMPHWLNAALWQDVARGLLVAESFWVIWALDTGRWHAAIVGACGGFMAALALYGLDLRFGERILAHAIWGTFTFGAWMAILLLSWSHGRKLLRFDRIMLAWLAVSPAGMLAYWFTQGTPANCELNDAAIWILTGLAMLWALPDGRGKVHQAD
jgi:hypothetical protein